MSYYLATIWNHIVTIEKYTTVKTFQNKLANDNEHGIKVSQNNLQCKYKLLFDLHLFWKKKTREKARPSYDFFLTHTFNAFYSLDYSNFTSLNIKKKTIQKTLHRAPAVLSVLAPSHFVCVREYGKEGTTVPQIQNGYCKNTAHLMMIRDQMSNYKKEKES